MIKISNMEQAKELILGATIMGTGGGGNPRVGMRIMEEIIGSGREVRIVSLGEVGEDKLVVSAYFVGSSAPTERIRKPVKVGDPVELAFRKLEEVIGKEVGAVVPCELSGSNAPAAIGVATKLGLPVVDGDLLGRAAPELHQCSALVHGLSMCPAVIVTDTGNVVVVEEYADIDDYESIARYLSVLSSGTTAVVDTPMTVKDARKAVIHGTISLCMKLGREVIKAREEGRDPVDAVARVLGGWRVFEGVVEKYVWHDEGGFLRGEVTLAGVGRYKGLKLRSWIKNEHIMVWVDGDPLVMPPDLFILMKDNGEPVINSQLKEGMKVNAVAAKAPEVWRSREGLRLFGPKHFGFDYEYVPVEELVEVLEKKIC